MWFRRASPVLHASVYFRGTLAPRLENIAGTRAARLTVKPLKTNADIEWSARVSHAAWGSAELVCPRVPRLPPDELIDDCSQLMANEQAAMRLAARSIEVRLLGTSEHILKDRKNLLSFCGVVMGEDGIAVLDNVSQLFWPLESLQEELSHDADLDITGLYVLHAVREEHNSDKVFWLHSHGLGELGFWDFDILRPGPRLLHPGIDALRGLAFLSAEGRLHPGSGRVKVFHPGGTVMPVSAAEFQKRCSANDRVLREPGETHQDRRVLICEPVRAPLRWFRAPEPSSFLSRDLPDRGMVLFSYEAAELKEARAKATYGILRRLAHEFADLGFTILLKMGFQTDKQKDRENLWFEVKSLKESSVVATLINRPFGISRLSKGDTGVWPIENLSDWTIITPKGWITPAYQLAARNVRANREEVARIMNERKRSHDA